MHRVGVERICVTLKWNIFLQLRVHSSDLCCPWFISVPAGVFIKSAGQTSGISFTLNFNRWCVCGCVYFRVDWETFCSLLHDFSLQFVVSHLSCLVDVFYSCRLLLAFSIRLVMRYSVQHAALNCTKPALASLSDTTAPPAQLKNHLV